MATVSIITSTYNRLDRLKACIESVRSQTFQDYEHIIVDDHSTDGTKDFLLTVNDPKIINVRRIRNFKCDTKPKNEGLMKATGKYIAFLDDDCTYRPDHLQALVNILDASPDVDLVYGDRWIIDETGKIQPQLGIFHDFDPYLLLQRNYIDTSDVLVRRNALFDVGGFDERYKKYVDWNLWVRLVKAGYTFARVPIILTNYHIHQLSKSMRPEDERGYNLPAWSSVDCDIYVSHLRKIEPPKVAIYSITYNRLDYTRTCFDSLRKTAGYEFDHYIVDNGSTDGTKGWLHDQNSQKKLKYVISNERNVGISKASNQILDAIGNNYDIIVKVDNDCYFKSMNWLGKMVDIWRGNRKIALSPYIEGLKDNPGGAMRSHYGQLRGEILGMTRHLGGICVFTDARAYKNFRWNETDFLHGIQDVEFSQHLLKEGYELGYLENYYAEHFEGTEAQHKRYPEYFERRVHEKTTRYEP